ncbi:MAG: SUMF1/EgtB/PvdO family nonheme iron enzyme [Planctomycetota bacterium]
MVFVQESPEAGDWHVAGITWWSAAAYCNWLHNGKALTPEAFTSGAYDLSTFGFDPAQGIYTDQTTRSPGARYWIPSLDEWMKAAHYDPNRYGPGEGGWWEYSNSSDTAPVTGLPGVGETNAYLVQDIGLSAWDMAVGSYPNTQSPWGLLDVSGGASEWTEEWLFDERTDRLGDGAGIGDGNGVRQSNPDFIAYGGFATRPASSLNHGLRVASAIPTPGVGVPLLAAALLTATRCRP